MSLFFGFTPYIMSFLSKQSCKIVQQTCTVTITFNIYTCCISFFQQNLQRYIHFMSKKDAWYNLDKTTKNVSSDQNFFLPRGSPQKCMNRPPLHWILCKLSSNIHPCTEVCVSFHPNIHLLVFRKICLVQILRLHHWSTVLQMWLIWHGYAYSRNEAPWEGFKSLRSVLNQ